MNWTSQTFSLSHRYVILYWTPQDVCVKLQNDKNRELKKYPFDKITVEEFDNFIYKSVIIHKK